MKKSINLIQNILKWRAFSRIEAAIIGSAVALSALILRFGVDFIGGLRVHLCDKYPPIIILPLFALIGGSIAGFLVQYVARDINGSGIPKVKSYLHNNKVDLSFKVLLSKLIGGTVTLGTGFSLGKEGPTVQVGASVAYLLSRFKFFPTFNIKQMVASGAGAGLAAAFNAPLSGVLFVIEELLKDISGFTVGNTAVACFFAAVISLALGNKRFDLSNRIALPITNFTVTDIPFCILLGVLCGIMGCLFNKLLIDLIKVNNKFLKDKFILRLAIAGLFVGVVIAILPSTFRDYAGLRHLLLHGHTSIRYAFIALAVNFILTLISYASGAPGGLFAPSLTIGCAMGYLFGNLELALISTAKLAPITLAYAGMAGMFAAIARVPITSMVIVFEITHDFNLFLPLMICSTVAFVVAEEIFADSIYDRLLEIDGVSIPKSLSEKVNISNLPCADVMHRNIETISADAKIDIALQKFKTLNYNDLPVIDNSILIGVLSKEDLLKRDEETDLIVDIYRKNPVVVKSDDELRLAVDLIENYKLNSIPVVDDNLNLKGIITKDDIFRFIFKPSQ